jgi:prevent-host-death family protein
MFNRRPAAHGGIDSSHDRPTDSAPSSGMSPEERSERTVVVGDAARRSALSCPAVEMVLVQIVISDMYTSSMEVAISELRAHLSEWLDRARAGSEIIVTDRGIPVARLLGVDASETLHRLTAEGVIGRPSDSARPRAKGRRRARTTSSVADLVGKQRR